MKKTKRKNELSLQIMHWLLLVESSVCFWLLIICFVWTQTESRAHGTATAIRLAVADLTIAEKLIMIHIDR